jgi:hypothetical protein
VKRAILSSVHLLYLTVVTPELNQLEEILDVLDRQIIGLPKHIQEKMVALERDVQDYREDVLSRVRDYQEGYRGFSRV